MFKILLCFTLAADDTLVFFLHSCSSRSGLYLENGIVLKVEQKRWRYLSNNKDGATCQIITLAVGTACHKIKMAQHFK